MRKKEKDVLKKNPRFRDWSTPVDPKRIEMYPMDPLGGQTDQIQGIQVGSMDLGPETRMYVQRHKNEIQGGRSRE
jgi:hypothetical protein